MSASDYSDVFISYRRKDVEITKSIVEALRASGREVWVDWEDIPPGSVGFSDDIKRGLEGADAFLALLSPAYLESPYCVDMELKYAVELKKKLIPVVLEKFDGHTVPADISHINWIYFTPHAGQENDFASGMQKVIAALDQDLEYVRAHTRLGLRASEWDKQGRPASALLRGTDIDSAEHWLASGVSKIPHPTQMQNDYIHASRKQEVRRQRQLLGGVSVALVLTVVLAIASVILGLDANQQRIEAEASRARASRMLLLVNAKDMTNVDEISAVSMATYSADNPVYLADSQADVAEILYAPGVRYAIEEPDATLTQIAHLTDNRVMSADANGILRIQTVHDGETAHRMQSHTNAVAELLATRDGTRAVSVGNDGLMILWDTATGEAVWRVSLPEAVVVGAALAHAAGGERRADDADDGQERDLNSGDESQVAVVFGTGIIHRYSMEDGALTDTITTALPENATAVTHAAVSPNLQYAVMSYDVRNPSSTNAVGLWTLPTKTFAALAQDPMTVLSVGFSADNMTFAAGTQNNEIYVWRIDANGIPQSYSYLVGHTDGIQTLILSRDGKQVATGSQDSEIYVWDVETDRRTHSFEAHERLVTDLALTGSQIISVSEDRRLLVWDLLDGSIEWLYDTGGTTNENIDGEFTADGTRIYMARDDRTVNEYDLQTRTLVMTYTAAFESGLNEVTLSPDQQMIAAADRTGGVGLWHVGQPEAFRFLATDLRRIAALDFSPDNTTLLYGGSTGDIVVYDIDADAEVGRLVGHEGLVRAVEYNADGTRAISGANDGKIILWDVETGEATLTIDANIEWILNVAYNADETQIIAGADDNTFAVWDAATGEQVYHFTGHSNGVSFAQFLPDSDWVITGSWDTTLSLWNVNNQERLHVMHGHKDTISALWVAPEGGVVLAASEDGVVIRWRLETLPQMIAWARENRVVRGLTCAEYKRFELPAGETCSPAIP